MPPNQNRVYAGLNILRNQYRSWYGDTVNLLVIGVNHIESAELCRHCHIGWYRMRITRHASVNQMNRVLRNDLLGLRGCQGGI